MHKLAHPQINQFRSEAPHLHNREDYYNGHFSQRATSEPEYETPYLPRGRPTKPKNPALILLHIKLDANTQRDIKCSLDDDPEILAEEFCQKHNLQKSLIPIITKMIQDQFTLAARGKSQKESVMKTPGGNSFMSAPYYDDKSINSRNKGSPEKSKYSQRDNIVSQETSGIVGEINGLQKKRKKPKLITRLNVNIGNNQTRDMLMYEGEDPAEVAQRFQEENNLPPALIGILVKQLIKSKELYNQRKDRVSEDESMTVGVRDNIKPAQMKEYQDYYRNEDTKYVNKEHDRGQNQIINNKSQPEFYHPNLANSRLFNNLAEKRNSEENKPEPRRNNEYQNFPDENKRVFRNEERIAEMPPEIKHAYQKPPVVDLRAFKKENEYKNYYEEERIAQKIEEISSIMNDGQDHRKHSDEDKREKREKKADIAPPKLNKNYQRSPDGSEEEKNLSGTANSYEKWQQLITEKRKIQESDRQSSAQRGRSQTPGRDSNMNFNLALKSLSPQNRKSTKSDTEKSVERSPKKLGKSKADEVVNRLYTNAKKRTAQNEWEYSPVKSNSPEKKKNGVMIVTYRPKQPKKKIPNLWGEDFIEGYVPSPRRAREIIRLEKERKETFTFSPYISENSRILAEKRNRSLSPIHYKLHAEAEKNKYNRNLLEKIGIEEVCTFQPNAHKFNSQSEAMEKGFLKRLAEREEIKQKTEAEEKEKRQKEEEMSPYDPVTGQKLFKPIINKDKYYLLAQKKDYRRVKEALEEQKMKQGGKNKIAEEKSLQKMRQIIKEKNNKEGKIPSMRVLGEFAHGEKPKEGTEALWNVFKKLDDDRDGFISDKKIELSELDPTTLEALIGILEIIEERRLTLDYKGFVELIDKELGPEETEIINAQNGPGNKHRQSNNEAVASKMLRDDDEGNENSLMNGSERSIPNEFSVRKSQDPEKVTMSNLTRHYQKILGKK